MAGALPRILVVDGSAPVRAVLRTMLQPKFECVEAASSREASARFAEQAIELVLLDLGLPDGSSVSWLAHHVEQDHRRIVVTMSGTARYSIAGAAMRCGAVDHLSRPFSAETLLRRIDLALVTAARHVA